jgi:hypothetical protein
MRVTSQKLNRHAVSYELSNRIAYYSHQRVNAIHVSQHQHGVEPFLDQYRPEPLLLHNVLYILHTSHSTVSRKVVEESEGQHPRGPPLQDCVPGTDGLSSFFQDDVRRQVVAGPMVDKAAIEQKLDSF